jgi:hypothetical protein
LHYYGNATFDDNVVRRGQLPGAHLSGEARSVTARA